GRVASGEACARPGRDPPPRCAHRPGSFALSVMTHRAVIFDLGGVVFPSPFEAFDAYDHGNDLAQGTMRGLIRRSSEEGAWAALERGELGMDEFAVALEAEADAAGFRLDARRLMTT